MLKRLAFAGALLCACSPAMAGGYYDDLFAHHASARQITLPPPANRSHRAARAGHRRYVIPQPVPRPVEHSGLLQVAQRFLGAGKITRQAGPWCRDFVNLVAREAGVALANNSRRAIDALGLGQHVSTPRAGDLIVLRHHVTIYAGQQGGRVIGLGGNQGHGRVKYSSYPRGGVLAFVRL